MAGRSDNRDGRDIATAQPEPSHPVRTGAPAGRAKASGRAATASGSTRKRAATPPPAEPVAGVVGDQSTTGSRSGEDARRRGWFWHWNNIVTQYAPLIGLKGVGLLNSYTVWTDRREESPHRGYAFPSQQSEAEFYGEDRAELITINKILVALDLIEIRKEMVLRVDEKGRRWKVPHNFYRVKDHGDDFTLTTGDVLKVVHLADQDRAVYRYLRRMFSPRFAPIDAQNVWHAILEEVRQDPAWQRLAARTEKDESRASARSKAGHAARRGSTDNPVFSLPDDGDNGESEATGGDSAIDTATGDIRRQESTAETFVASINNGSATGDDGSNKGLAGNHEPDVAATNRGDPTSVEPTNRTYYQSITTTTTGDDVGNSEANPVAAANGPGAVPDSQRVEALVIRQFEEANDRHSTPAERRLLRQLAETFDAAATETGHNGWEWLGFAIDDAVAAGSRFVAPRRVREILSRWQRDGLPGEYLPIDADPAQATSGSVTSVGAVSHRTNPGPVTASDRASHRSARERVARPEPVGEDESFVAPVFTIAACGMTNRQVWQAVLGDLEFSGAIGRADVSTWLRGAALLAESGDGGLVLGVPHELALRRASGRYLGAIRQAVERVTGLALPVTVVLFRDWAA